MIYFSSDLHLAHSNIIKFCNRPFKDVNEMDKTIIDNINNTITKHDELYILGDIGFEANTIDKCFKKWYDLELDIKFIIGGHDKWKIIDLINKYFENKGPVHNLRCQLGGKLIELTLSHYPMVTWNKSHYGTWNLYGHHHSKYQDDRINKMCPGKRMNVGVDLNNFMPVSLAMVAEHMKSMPDNWDILK